MSEPRTKKEQTPEPTSPEFQTEAEMNNSPEETACLFLLDLLKRNSATGASSPPGPNSSLPLIPPRYQRAFEGF